MGYQILELPSLDILIKNIGKSEEITLSIFLWIIDELNNSLELEEIEIKLVGVNYLGKYPSIGLLYLNTEIEDKGKLVENKGEFILKNYKFEKFLKYLDLNQDFISNEISNYRLVN